MPGFNVNSEVFPLTLSPKEGNGPAEKRKKIQGRLPPCEAGTGHVCACNNSFTV